MNPIYIVFTEEYEGLTHDGMRVFTDRQIAKDWIIQQYRDYCGITVQNDPGMTPEIMEQEIADFDKYSGIDGFLLLYEVTPNLLDTIFLNKTS